MPNDSDPARSAANAHARLHCSFRSGGKQHVDPRSEPNETNKFPLGNRIAYLLPAYNAAGDQSRNLCEHEL